MLNDYEDMSYNELIEAIIAAGNPYAGRNSKLDRSLRARRQLRDRKGRWIYMGGGLGFTVRMPDGTLYRVLGRSVGASRREGFVQVYVPDGTAEGFPGGFYDVPASGSDVVQAILPGQEGAGKYTGSPTAAEIVNLGDLQVKDAPDGWRKNRDGSYTSEGGEYTVTSCAPAVQASGAFDISFEDYTTAIEFAAADSCKIKLQRDGRTVATFNDPATAIARAAKTDIQETADPETKKVVARLKKDVTAARRSLRDSTTEEEAAQAQEALKQSAEKVDRALFNDPDIVGEQDFEAERRAKEIAGLQAQDEELDRENTEIESKLEGMNRRTAEAQKLKARQREIAEERADISDSIAELSPQPETDGPTPPDGTDTPQAGPDEDGDGEPDYYVDPATGEIIDDEPDEVLQDGGVYILDGDRVQEEDVADWLSKAPEYSQIFIKGTNADGQPELYKFIKSPSGDWIEFSFTSETIPMRTSEELADFMRRQRTNGGLVASDESAINGGDLPTIEDALDDLRLEAEGKRERRPGDFQRARERARRVLNGDSGVEFEEGFDPANQEVVTFDREDGPPKEFYRPQKMWANYFHKGDWVEGADGKWRQVVNKETYLEMRPSLDPAKGPYSYRRHTITFDDGSTYEIETQNGWPSAAEKKNKFQVVRADKDRRFEAQPAEQPQAEQPAQPAQPAEPGKLPMVEPRFDETPTVDFRPIMSPKGALPTTEATPAAPAVAAPADIAAEAARLDALTPEPMEFEKGWRVDRDENGNVVLARTVGSPLTPGGPKTETKPLQYLYRAVSDAEWEGIKKNGYMKTNGLENLDNTSGTYATHEDPSAYLPGGLGVGGRIIRIAYDPSDDWGVVDLNGYVQTDKNVPSSRIEAVSASTIGTGAAARDPKDPELAGDVVRNVASNMIARAEADRRAAKDAGDTEREQMLEGVLADINKVREQFMLSDGNLVELQDIDSEGYLQAIENIQASAPEYSGSQDTNKDIDAARKILSTTKTEAAPTEGAEPVTAKRPFNDDLTRAFNYQYGSNLDFRYLIADNGRAKPTVVTPEGLQQAIADGATPIYRVEGLSWNGEATDEDGEPIEDSPAIRADKLRTSDIPPFKDGDFGFGIYFSNDYEEVKNNYSDPEGNDYFVAAALPKDAKVISYAEIQALASERRDQARARSVERQAALERGEELVEPPLTDEEIRERAVNSALLHYTGTTQGASALASQLGYDAIVETFGEGENQYSYYVVLNRGKLIVSDTDAREAANGQTPENTRQVDATPDNSPETVADDVVTVENADQAAEETSSPIVIAQQKAVSEAAKGRVDAALKPPRAPREPSIGAATGRLAELLKDAKTPEEVRDIINSQEITYIDFETTGFSAVPGDGELNRPIQMGIVKVRNGEVVDQRNIWMNPDTELSEWSRSNLKDANNQPLTQEWLAQQPSMEEAMREAVEFMGSNAILAGQNVQFDLEVLGRTLRDQGIDFTWDGTLDTRDMSAGSLPKYDPETGVGPHKTNRDGTKSHSNSLGDIVNFLNEEGFNILQENWHTADEDALVSHKIMQAMLQRAINTDTPLDFMWDGAGKPEEWAAYNREYAKYRDELRKYFEATNDPNIEERMAQAEPLRLEDLAPAFSGQAPSRVPDTAEVSAIETAVDDANATVDKISDQLDRTVDQAESSDILDTLVDEVEKADKAQTEAAKAIVASNDDELSALNRHIARLDGAIRRAIDRDQDASNLMAEQEALIEQRNNLERGETDGPGDFDGGGQEELSVPESGPNSSRVKLERRGDQLRDLDGNVVARLASSVSNADQRRERGEVVLDMFEIEKGYERIFVDAITEAKAANKKYGSSVDVHDEEYYANARVFISEDGLVGAALNGGEEIVSVFRHPNAAQGVAGPLLGKLVELGGRRLDAMDTILPYIYAREGFKPVGRIDWVEKFAPDGWDKEVYAKYKKGEPDVVFMVFDPERVGSEYTPGEGTRYEDYTQAMDVAIKVVENTRAQNQNFVYSDIEDLDELRIPEDAEDFQSGAVPQDPSGRPSVAALRAAKVGQVIEYTFANGRKGRFVKMSRDIWRRADNPNDTKKYFSSNFRADKNLTFAEPTDSDIPSVEPTPARKFAAIDPRPYAVPRNLSPEEYQTLRNVYADQVENGTTERDRLRAEETVYLLDRIIARNEGRTLPRRADRVTRSIQRRQRAAGETPAQPERPARPATEAPETPAAEPERKIYDLRSDNPEGIFLDPAPYQSQGTGVDGTTDNPADLIDLFDQKVLTDSFLKAIRDQESAINMEFPNGSTALIPTEAVRDALQLLGVDTTSLTNEYMRDIEEILDDNRPRARQQPFDNSVRITREEQLANLFATRKAWQEELARFISANPKAPADQINWRMDRITQINGRIGRLQAAGIKMPYEVENIDLRNRMKMDGPDTYRPEFVWQAVKDAYPDAVELNDRELLLAQNTVTDANGNQFIYSAIVTKTDDEQFYTYIREENVSEKDPAKKFRSMRVTSFRHSATAVLGRGGSKKDGADYAIGKVLERGAQDKINSWFNSRERQRNGMYITQDTVDEQGNPTHTRQQIITRDALTRIMEATDSDTVSEEMVYSLYNYIAEFGSGPAVLNELVKSYNIDENVVFQFVDAINANLGNRDQLNKFVLWESNAGIPLFENDRVTYVGTKTQTGHPNLYGKTGRVQIRQLLHTQTTRGVPYTYTDYVYVQFEDENGNPEGEYTIVAAKNLRIDSTSGGTDGSERVGPNAISIPRPVLTARALNRHSARQTIADVLPFIAEYDRSIPSSPTVEINGEKYGVQVSRVSTIGEHLQQRTVLAEDMEVGDFYFTYDEETGSKRLAEVIGIDIQSDGSFLVTTAIPIDLGSAKVNQTSYSPGFDMPFEIYREVEPMRPLGAPGEGEPESPITPSHRDRLREALARVDKRQIEPAILSKAYGTINNSTGGAANMREFEDILREVLAAMPANGAQPERRLSVPEAAKVINNSLEVGTPNPEAERWVRQVVDAGLIKEDELRNDPDVPADAVAEPTPTPVPDTTAVPGPTTRVNAPTAPTSPGTPVSRQWFWDAEPGALVSFPNMYGDGTGETLRKMENGSWVDTEGNVVYERTTDIIADFTRNPDMGAAAYDVTQSAPSSDASVSGLVIGDTPNEDWFLQTGVGSKIRRSVVGDANSFVDVEKIDTDVWRDTMGRTYSTRQVIDTFYYDERNSVRRINTKIQEGAKPRDNRPSDQRVGDQVDESWINGVGAGEYVEVTLPDGKKIVYLSRKLNLGDPGRDIIWTPVSGLPDRAGNALDTSEFVAKYVNDESTAANILGRRFFSWTDVSRGDAVPSDVDWFIHAPSSTTLNFPFKIPGENGEEETIMLNARKTPSGDWKVVNVTGQKPFSALSSSQDLVQMFPEEGATRGHLDFVSLPQGQRAQFDEDFPLDDKPYTEISTGPYSVEDAIPSISSDEFREAMEVGDERMISEVVGQIFANRRFGSEFRLADLALSVSLGSFQLRAKIKDSDGNNVGDVVRDYEIEADGKFTVNHTKIWINNDAKKRTGFASEFKKFSTDFYRYAGVDLVTIGTVDDGSLVWAGMGYTWNNQSETSGVTYRLQNLITQAQSRGDSQDLKVLLDLERRFQLDFNHEDYPDPMDLAFLQYEDPSGHTNTMAHDLLHSSLWGGILYLNEAFDPRPESRRNKKREDYKDGKYKGFTDAEGNESDDVSGRYVDEDGNITDAFMWLDTAEDGTFVSAIDSYDEPSLYIRENGVWYRATFGGASDSPADRESVSETDLARFIGENGARVPDEDETMFYQDYFDGSVDTDYIDQEALVEAFRQGDLVVIESVLRNELFGGGDAQYGELSIEGLNFQLRKATTDGVPTSYVHVNGQLVYEGDVVGDLARTFTVGADGKLSVMHKNLTITRMGVRGRGKGFGTEFTQASEDFYERMDVQFANLEAWYNGGWYWADKGYGWDIRHYDEANGLESFMGHIPNRLENALVTATNEGRVEDAAQIREILSRLKRFKPGQSGFPTPQEIRQLKDSKTIMEDSRWRGIKYFGSARPDPEALREEAGAPELDGWEFVDTQSNETSAALAEANVDAAAEAYLGLYGSRPDERRLENLRSIQRAAIDDYFVYQRGNVVLYVSKDEATGSTEKVQKILELQRKLIDSMPLQQGRPVRLRITKNQTRTSLGTASPSYAQVLYTPGGASNVTLYTENISRMPGTEESRFAFTRAGNPAFGDLALGTLAHEWGHLIDFDSSGMSSLNDDDTGYLSLEFERRVKAFDAKWGTNFWNTISGYVNSRGVSNKPKQKGKPQSRVLEAWAESFAQFVAQEYFGDTSDTVIARIVRELLEERGYIQ